MKSKRKKPTLTQKRKESLLRQVRRMESRGYWFDEDIRKIIRELSPQKTRFFTTETLYQRASAINAITGEPLTGIQARAMERKEAARKAALTRRRRRESAPLPPVIEEPEPLFSEDIYDATDEVLDNFSSLVSFFDRPISPNIVTVVGKTVPKSDKIGNYEASVKNYLRTIFEEERRKDPRGLAERIYERSSEIDELIGVIDTSGYMENIRVAGNNLIRIIRGTGHLSSEDRRASEDLANETWEDYE